MLSISDAFFLLKIRHHSQFLYFLQNIAHMISLMNMRQCLYKFEKLIVRMNRPSSQVVETSTTVTIKFMDNKLDKITSSDVTLILILALTNYYKILSEDSIEQARQAPNQIFGRATGAYSHSKGVMGFHDTVAAGNEARDGFPADPNGIFLTDGARFNWQLKDDGSFQQNKLLFLKRASED